MMYSSLCQCIGITYITCENKSLVKSSCSFSTCLRASPYIDAALAKISSSAFSMPYLLHSSDNLVPNFHTETVMNTINIATLETKYFYSPEMSKNCII